MQAPQPQAAQPQAPQPQPAQYPQTQYVTAVATSATRGQRSYYNDSTAKQAYGVGITQICIGILSIIFQIVAIAVHASASVAGTGIWCGVLFIISGALGAASGRQRSLGLVVGAMVMSIISAIFCIGQLTSASIGYSIDRDYTYYRYSYYHNYYRSDSNLKAAHAMNIMLLILALAEAAIAIWQSALCCAACCCSGTGRPAAVQYTMAGNGQQVIVIPIGQQQPGGQYHVAPVGQYPVAAGGQYPVQAGTQYPMTGYVAMGPGVPVTGPQPVAYPPQPDNRPPPYVPPEEESHAQKM